MSDFEKAFENFIECREYEQAENALFSLVRLAFKAGWLAAGGRLPPSRKVHKIESAQRKISFEGYTDGMETKPGDK